MATRCRVANGSDSRGTVKRVLFSCGGGFLLAALFPPFGFSFLAFFALAPFLFLLENTRGRHRFLLPWGSMIVFFGLVLYWIPRVMVVYGGLSWVLSILLYLLLCLALAAFYSPAVICFLFMHAIRPWCAYVLFPFAWVACDLVRNSWMVNGFPWASLGYTQIDRLWAQVADIGGIYLVTFLVVAVNAALAYAWLYRTQRIPALLTAAMLALSAAYGLQKWKVDYLPSNLPVGLVQPVIETDLSNSYMREKYLVEIPAMVRELALQGARLVVLPEAPSIFDYYRDSAFAATLEKVAMRHQVALIFNNTTAKSSGEYYNSMIFMLPDGSTSGRYDKIHLVPFGEYVPGERWLFFAHPLVQEVSSFSPGEGVFVANVGGVRVGGFICYEAIFPELVRKFAVAGAELLVNITNDAWYGKTAAAAQHLQIARMRSIETRRFMVRAANSGISAVVEPNGRVKRRLGMFERGTFVAGVRPLQALTFYARHGDLFAQACVWIFIGGLLSGRLYRSYFAR